MGGADDDDVPIPRFHNQFPGVAHGLDFNVQGGGIWHIGPEQGKALFFRDAAQSSFLMAAHGDQQGHLWPELHNLFSGEFRGKGIHAQFH